MKMKYLLILLISIGFISAGDGDPLLRMKKKISELKGFVERIEEENFFAEGERTDELDLEGVERVMVRVYFVNLEVKESGKSGKGSLDTKLRAVIPSGRIREMIRRGEFLKIEKEGGSLFIFIPEWQEEGKETFITLEGEAILELPKNLPLTIQGKFSKITVREYSSPLSIEEDFGRVEIVSHRGSLNMETNYSEIKIKDQRGKMDGKFEFSDIELLKAEGDVSLYSNFGNLKIEEIIGNAELRIKGGADIGKVYGNLSIETKFGWTEVGHIKGDLTLSNLMGDVFIKRVDGRREVNSKYGTVRFANIEIRP
jgi:hypothetical protein